MTAAPATPSADTPPSGSPSIYRRAVVLGLLTAIAAFAIDMYIPSFAMIAVDLKTDPGTVQLSMTSFFLALAVGQVVYGPISDAVGRRAPIFVGLAFYLVASLGAVFAPTIGWLIAARFVQGIGAAAAAVVPLAVIRDEYVGPEAARVLALCMLSLSVSPIIAPVAGGLLVQVVSWRVIFVILIAIALAVTVMVTKMLPETHPPEKRVSAHPVQVAMTYWSLLKDVRFMAPIAVAAAAQAVLFLFISGSPFVFVTLHQVSPTTYGVIFALHAIALIGISQFNGWLMKKIGTVRLLCGATAVASITGLVLAASVLSGMSGLVPFVIMTLIIFTCIGLILAPGFMTAMEPFGENAGAAAALGSGLEFACSSLMTALMGVSMDGTARPLACFIALAACASFGFWVWMVRTRKALAA